MAQSLAYLYSERTRLLQDIANVRQQIAYAQQNANPSIVAGLETRLASSLDLLAAVDAQIQAGETEQTLGTASAGNLARDDQLATAPGSLPQNPNSPQQVLTPDGRIATVPDTTSGTNATNATDATTAAANNVDVGTDSPTRTIQQTQSTPAAPDGLLKEPGPSIVNNNTNTTGTTVDSTVAIPPASTQIGAGASGEDTGVAKNATKTEVDNVFSSQAIVPQPNVLGQYGSYTYQASVYLMGAEAYKTMCETQQKNLQGSQLLFQSAGAPVTGRNPYFTNDYYIDKITLESVITGKGTNLSHNVNSIKMTVIEPNGITLIGNMDKALNAELGPDAKKKNFNAQQYLLVIRFYGYDQNGQLLQANNPGIGGFTDAAAFVEKFYPMCITNIKFKVANKLVEYDIEAASVPYNINTGSNRGSIPYNVELSSGTVKDVLAGSLVSATSQTTATNAATGTTTNTNSTTIPPAPGKANAATSVNKTIRQGLMAALNAYQAELVARGTYQHPDVYSVEFANPSIASASIVVKGADKKSKPMTNATTAAGAIDPRKQSMDNSARTVSIVAGTQVVQAIDLILRSSSYITDQAAVVVDENNQVQQSNGAPAQNLAWYKISLRATPGPYDYKRNDYSYNITYVISAYKINQMVSDYFLSPKYNGVHKQYNYWFTGENTEVLSYEQNYNALYSAVLSGGPGGQFVNEAIKKNFQPRSGESSQGAQGRTNEIGANAADYLYNPNDLALVNLQIVGDPAWLQQGEAFSGASASNFNFGPFLPDGTINYEAQQILFEILINTPQDYDLSTGLIDPNTQSTIFQNGAQTPGAARQSYVYMATQCTSEFVKGKFTQVLKGALLTYMPDQTFKENQQSAIATAQAAVNALSFNRQTSINLTNIAGSLSTPAFSPLASSSFGQLATRATQIGLNVLGQNVLGTIATKAASIPGLPTSSGQVVGAINNIFTPPGRLPSVNTPGFNPTAGVVDSVSNGTTQVVAASDDSGEAITKEYLNAANNNTTQQLDLPESTPADLGDFYG
jgi:hypothetical protein